MGQLTTETAAVQRNRNSAGASIRSSLMVDGVSNSLTSTVAEGAAERSERKDNKILRAITCAHFGRRAHAHETGALKMRKNGDE